MRGQVFSDAQRMAQELYGKGDFAGAEAQYRQALQLDSSWPDGWRLLGFCLHAQNRYPEAVNAFRTAVGLQPDHAENHFGLGLASAGTNELDQSIASLDEALRLRPDHAHAKSALIGLLMRRADGYFASQQDQYGEHDLDRAIKLDRKNVDPVIKMARHLMATGMAGRAKNVVEASLLSNPLDPKLKEVADDLGMQVDGGMLAKAANNQQRNAVKQSQQVPCPSCKQMVMEWAIICPNCNFQIKARPSQFAGRADQIPNRTWQEIAYVVVGVLWVIRGLVVVVGGIALGGFEAAVSGFALFFTLLGLFNVFVGIGLLCQWEWVQFLAKIMCYSTLLFGSYGLMMNLMTGRWISVAEGLFSLGLAGFQLYLLNYVADV